MHEISTRAPPPGAEGRTIVCTIHSPTSKAFALFDDLLVLKGGKLAFGGPVSRVEAYSPAS